MTWMFIVLVAAICAVVTGISVYRGFLRPVHGHATAKPGSEKHRSIRMITGISVLALPIWIVLVSSAFDFFA